MVSIASYNVRGISGYPKRSKIFNFLKNKYYDIICLQEIHSVKNIAKIWKSQWGGQTFYSHGTSNSKGCMILIKRKQKTVIHHIDTDQDGRYVILDLTVNGYHFMLCNLYAPNDDNVTIFQEILKKIDDSKPDQLIITGDFNTILGQKDKKGSLKNSVQPGHPKCTQFLQQMMVERNLLDIWRLHNPDKECFTWVKSRPYVLMERLDFFLISGSLTGSILCCDIDSSFMSDHAIPYITLFDLEGYFRGPGYWKLNTKSLEEEGFCEMIREQLKECESFKDKKFRWEMFKMLVHGKAIKFGARRKKSNVYKLEALQHKLDQIIFERDSMSQVNLKLFEDHDRQIMLIQKDIQDLIANRSYNSSMANRGNWFADGEKSSK